MRRYLFGPVTAAFADQNLRQARVAGDCLAFGPAGADLALTPGDSWGSLCARLPAGWRPDFVALWLPYAAVPPWLWSAPVPLVALAADWNLLWHGYRLQLPRCELALTDAAGVEALAVAGLPHARPANLFGCEEDFLGMAPAAGRDIDVLFVGNLHPAVQRERAPWLARLARLGDRWRVHIAVGVFGPEYRALLARARVVFNRGVRGECNRRAFEAAAAGALLFQEAGNREVPGYFRDRRECVCYTDDDLEQLLEHYLSHEDERGALAGAARARVQDFSFAALWAQALGQVEAAWPDLEERAKRRPAFGAEEALLARTWQAASGAAEPALVADLEAALSPHPGSAALHNALGVAVAAAGRGGGPVTAALARQAAEHFHRAAAADPHHPLALLNLAEALVGINQDAAAAESARNALEALEQGDGPDSGALEAPHFPPVYDHFRVEWERAAWQSAGRPAAEREAKLALLRWRLHTVLADLTGDLGHYHEAALARPDLPPSRAALGCALARAGRRAEALPHLRMAVAADPLDAAAARALHQALSETGNRSAAARLARDRRLLSRAAPQAVPPEPRFAQAPPPLDGLASVLILCCNEVEYTRPCLESVLRHTRAPYELVLVDNGSTDETPALLEEVRARPGPERVEVIRNETNLGFPAGCNLALARARGDYVVFLNNDTVVTEGWLDGLVGWALHDWPKVGLVGAVSNYTRPPQQVAAGYAGLEGLPAFAARLRREQAGRSLGVERLAGFCLLARREVLEKVGGFDERFGVGFFDDDDLSVRALKAGYKLLVAQDVFVHHFGSRTFAGLGIDCRKQLRENFERFKEKWGTEQAAGYRPPGAAGERGEAVASPTALVPAAAGPRPKVSLCMIVKDEEDNLPACLGSAADLVDEVVVVDTGSADRTKQVVARYGARVLDFPWCDSFAAARNESLRHARGEWVFWLDADDRLDEDNRGKLRALFAGLGGENAAYAMKCLCLPSGPGAPATVVDHVRLFRNDPRVRWEYRVHEQVLPSVRRAGGEVRWADVVVRHSGYQDPALRGRKLQRDLRLLHLEDADRPDDPFTLFNLGSVYQELGRPAEALPLLRRSLARSEVGDSIVRKLYALIVGCHRQLGQAGEAAAALAEGRRHYPDDTELLFLEALLRRERGDRAGAEAALRRVLAPRRGDHFASVDAGLAGYKARQNLALLCHEQGRAGEAEALWREVLAEEPGFVPAWLGLAEVALGRKDWGKAEEVAGRLPEGAAAEAAVLKGRALMGRGDYPEGQRLLHEAVAAHPQALWPRVILSHAYLQEGKDPVAAEKALRDVLALAPGHAEARNNLAVLLRQRGAASRDEVFAGDVELGQLYEAACATPSDINEHLPTLYALARECRHVTEMGTRTGLSTTALLLARPEVLVCYDLVRQPQVDKLEALAGRTEFVFRQEDVLAAEIEPTDLLFIDTLHTCEQLREELRLHAGKARRYVVLHDTTTFGERGELPGSRGLWPAVEELLALGTFRLKARFENNNGLTVLEAVAGGPTDAP